MLLLLRSFFLSVYFNDEGIYVFCSDKKSPCPCPCPCPCPIFLNGTKDCNFCPIHISLSPLHVKYTVQFVLFCAYQIQYNVLCFVKDWFLTFFLKQQERPNLSEDISPELAFIIQACWVEDPNLRPSFDQIIRMLNTFLFTLPPPPSATSPEECDAADDVAAAAASNGELSARSRRKFSFLRQIFAAKKTKNSQWVTIKIFIWLNRYLLDRWVKCM